MNCASGRFEMFDRESGRTMSTSKVAERNKTDRGRNKLSQEGNGCRFADSIEVEISNFVKGSSKNDHFRVYYLSESSDGITVEIHNFIKLIESLAISAATVGDKITPGFKSCDSVRGNCANGCAVL